MVVHQLDRQHSWDYAERNPLLVIMDYIQYNLAATSMSSRDTYTPPADRLAKLLSFQMFVQCHTAGSTAGIVSVELQCLIGGVTTLKPVALYFDNSNTAGDYWQQVVPGGIIATEDDDWDLLYGYTSTGGAANVNLTATFIEFDV